MSAWLQRLFGRSDVYFGGSLYMRRWKLGPVGWFGIRLHHIVRSDADRELHDHPFSYLSIILRGGYHEHTLDGRRVWYGPGSIVWRSAETLHRLELSDSHGVVPAWTFVIRGPYRRMWGFLTPRGWQDWRAFTAERQLAASEGRPFAAPSSL